MLKSELEVEVTRLQDIVIKAAKKVVDSELALKESELTNKTLKRNNDIQVRELETLKENIEKTILLITMRLETNHLVKNKKGQTKYKDDVDTNTLRYLKSQLGGSNRFDQFDELRF